MSSSASEAVSSPLATPETSLRPELARAKPTLSTVACWVTLIVDWSIPRMLGVLLDLGQRLVAGRRGIAAADRSTTAGYSGAGDDVGSAVGPGQAHPQRDGDLGELGVGVLVTVLTRRLGDVLADVQARRRGVAGTDLPGRP